MKYKSFSENNHTSIGISSLVKPELDIIRIEPSRGWVSLKLYELWEYRELLYFLIWRDIKIRYKQTALGGTWAIIQPFFTMVVFSIFFGKLAEMPSDGIPYPIFTYTALVPWSFFSNGLNQASNSLVGNSNLITKIYFPRMTLPIASVSSGLLDFILAFTVLWAMILYYGINLTANIFWLPIFLIQALCNSLGASLWLSAVYVKYHDVRHVIPFLTQIWLFATPIAYPSSLIPEPLRTLYGINPMSGVIEGFRWSLLNNTAAPIPMIIISLCITIGLLLSGAFYFRRMERTFADIV